MGPLGTPVLCTPLNAMPLGAREPSQYVSRHAGQLSLAITPWWARAVTAETAGDRSSKQAHCAMQCPRTCGLVVQAVV